MSIGEHLSEYQRLEEEARRLCAIWIEEIQRHQPRPVDFSSLREAQPYFDAQQLANEYYEKNIRKG